MKKQKGKHGGPRPGSGRPRKPPVTIAQPAEVINWAEIERFANVGGLEDEIVAAGLVSEEQTKSPEVADRLRKLVERGSARKKLLLREEIDKLGRGDAKGSSNTLRLQAQALLGWEKQMENQEPPPDLTSAHASLRLTLGRLAKVKSEELGREVTPAELLFAMVYPKDGEKVH